VPADRPPGVLDASGTVLLAARGIERHPGVLRHQTVRQSGNDDDLVREG